MHQSSYKNWYFNLEASVTGSATRLFFVPHSIYILFTNDFKVKYDKFVRMGIVADDTAFWTIPSIETHLKAKLLQKELYRFTD